MSLAMGAMPAMPFDAGWASFACTSTRAWGRHDAETGACELIVVGELVPEVALWQQSFLDAAIACSGPGHAFFDWSGATGLRSEYRKVWQRWIGANEGSVLGADFLTGSTVLAMAITVANLVSPRARFRVHRARGDYEVARARLLPDAPAPTR